MRIAVTGAGGGLGRAFVARAPAHHDLHPFTRAELPVDDYHAAMQTLVPLAPDAILHLAAKTSVDECERDEDDAFRQNAIGTRNVALAARACGAMLLAVSTDYVFDGSKGAPYHEFDGTHPVNVYGRSKLAGEEAARDLVPESYVVRTSWIFGGGKDFLTTSLERLRAGETLGAIVDRTGTPTYVAHLADRLIPVLLSGRFGTVHLGGPEPTTWHDALVRAKALGGLPGEVEEQKEGDLGRPAPRPVNSALTSLVAGEMGVPPMPPLDDALGELLRSAHGR